MNNHHKVLLDDAILILSSVLLYLIQSKVVKPLRGKKLIILLLAFFVFLFGIIFVTMKMTCEQLGYVDPGLIIFNLSASIVAALQLKKQQN